MKHGPIALIDEHMPVVAIAPQDRVYDKMISQIEQVKARWRHRHRRGDRGGRLHRDQGRSRPLCPAFVELLTPVLTVIPLQLLAYHIAVRRGADVDQPRNLAKSVTVE